MIRSSMMYFEASKNYSFAFAYKATMSFLFGLATGDLNYSREHLFIRGSSMSEIGLCTPCRTVLYPTRCTKTVHLLAIT